MAVTELKPQEGPQRDFLESQANIAIYGGAAGSGKSFALLLEPLYHVQDVANFAAVVFRRTTVQIRMPGGLWDESLTVYGSVTGATPSSHVLEWHFRGGGKVKFAGLEYDQTVLDWHGAQVPLICFDELTTFTQHQFFYLLSRNRSMTGVRPYVRATCNPDADSWVAKFIAWWINQDTGFPIPERAGKLRWFMRVGDNLHWADNPQDLHPSLIGAPEFTPDGDKIDYTPKSVTFIPAKIYDNKELLKVDPGYLANLMALPTVERERLLGGNWKVRPTAGLYFRRDWVGTLIKPHELPKGLSFKRGWDLAGTAATQTNDPDWTASTKGGRALDGNYYVVHATRMRGTPDAVERHVLAMAQQDGRDCEVWLPQDPGQAAKAQMLNYVRLLDGYSLRYSPERGDKIARFGPFSARAEHGFVRVVEGDWNEAWFEQLEGFPDLKHDDDVDATSRWFNAYLDSTSGLIDYYAQLANEVRAKHEEANNPELPKLESGAVRVRSPNAETNILYDMKGRPLVRDAEGCFIVDIKHYDLLKRSGFKIVEGVS